MPIKSVFRFHYERTGMGRDALFVDVALPEGKSLRIGTTHLESLAPRVPVRPAQLAAAAKFMHEADASIIGGDMNAIQPFDKTLHLDNGLKDAYLESGGVEGAESGMTWGQMAGAPSRRRFGLSRMDKLLYCGGLELAPTDGEGAPPAFETFGMDVVIELENDDQREEFQDWGLEKPWATDHLGVKGRFRVALS